MNATEQTEYGDDEPARAPPDQRRCVRFGGLLALTFVWLLALALWQLSAQGLLAPDVTLALGFGFLLMSSIGGTVAWRWMDRVLARGQRRDALLNQLAVTDAMTGLSNHRGFLEVLERDFARSRRYGHPLSLMRIDIDFFKRINDGYGHAVGDEVIVALANKVRDILRSNIDLVARMSGAGFGVLLPDTAQEAAGPFAERLRERIADIEIATSRGDVVHFTVSIGVAGLHPGDSVAEATLVRAETAMQLAKDEGRNRVEVAAFPAAPAPAVSSEAERSA